MPAIATFLVVLVLSIVIVRIATIALSLTGLSHESAKFQARSAWTGTGFTTTESEQIVNHPVRRRVVTILMVMRGAGLVTMLTALMIGFGQADQEQSALRFVILIGGVAALWAVSSSRRMDLLLRKAVRRVLKKYTGLDTRDYASLFHIGGEYGISELLVEDGDWLAERTLAELKLSEEGVLVLAVVKPDGTYSGAPRGTRRLVAGDQILVYGRTENLRQLDDRRAGLEGEAEHQRARLERHHLDEEEEQAAEQAEAEQAEDEAAKPGE